MVEPQDYNYNNDGSLQLVELLEPSEYSRELLYQIAASREIPDKVTPAFFLAHYMDFVSMVIANGKPSKDTLDSYKHHISKFLTWCLEKSRVSPFKLKENHIELYRTTLYQTPSAKGTVYDDNSIHLHFAAIRAFYNAAIKQHIIDRNPCEGIKAKTVYLNDRSFAYYSMEEIRKIIEYIRSNFPEFEALRNLACIYLMAVAGLRCVEVQRANREDIDWNNLTMVVHGKGHDGMVYLEESTAKIIQDYLDCLDKQPFKVHSSNGITPLIVTYSPHLSGTRLNRR